MRTLHLFAGAGGGLYADLILGHTPVAAVEHSAHACAILRERADEGWWPGLAVHEQDVREFDAAAYAGEVDCLAAGFPCQDISVAGCRAGLSGSRSGLFSEVVRIAGDCRPEWIFLENSAQITTRGLDRVLCELACLGFDAAWCVLPACAVGAPHQRARWWLLGRLADADERRCTGSQVRSQLAWRNEAERSGEDVSNTAQSERLAWADQESEKINESTLSVFKRNNPWATEPELGRVAYGVAHRNHRIERLGEGQVPLQAAAAWLILEQRLCPQHVSN